MTIPPHDLPTKEAFLAWVERREERYEFSAGRVIERARATRNHARVATNLLCALASRLQRKRYDVFLGAFAVHIDDSVRFPDVLVEPAQADGSPWKRNTRS